MQKRTKKSSETKQERDQAEQMFTAQAEVTEAQMALVWRCIFELQKSKYG